MTSSKDWVSDAETACESVEAGFMSDDPVKVMNATKDLIDLTRTALPRALKALHMADELELFLKHHADCGLMRTSSDCTCGLLDKRAAYRSARHD